MIPDAQTPHRQRRLVQIQLAGYRLPPDPWDVLDRWSKRLGLGLLALTALIVVRQWWLR